jgi:hypothetical protein
LLGTVHCSSTRRFRNLPTLEEKRAWLLGFTKRRNKRQQAEKTTDPSQNMMQYVPQKEQRDEELSELEIFL